jgi:hypothetical protein
MKRSREKKTLIFRATFTEDTPEGTECFVKYGYTPSWDFVKNAPVTCVTQSVEEAASEEKQDAAEAPKTKNAKKDKRQKKDKKGKHQNKDKQAEIAEVPDDADKNKND